MVGVGERWREMMKMTRMRGWLKTIGIQPSTRGTRGEREPSQILRFRLGTGSVPILSPDYPKSRVRVAFEKSTVQLVW
jgi:hypothetical protein